MPTLNWIGKDKVIHHHLDVPVRALEQKYVYGVQETGEKVIKQSSAKDSVPNTQNMIIHGDNLEALKALLPMYEGKVKCIYIDPPYNTGNDAWIYNDNVNHPKIQKWLHNVVGKEGEDLSRHDKWLCMMYPRLVLLRRLLSEDGVIFISIDDNEQANLKLMMDEIFGSGNFVANMVRENKVGSGHDSEHLAIEYDYILTYSKDIKILKFHKKILNTEEDTKYKLSDDFLKERGRYYLRDLDYKGSYSKSLDYPITAPDGTIMYAGNQFGEPNTWRWSKDKFDWGIENHFIVFKQKSNKWKVYIKQYQYVDNNNLFRQRTVPYRAMVKFLNGEGSQEVNQILRGIQNFSFPKSCSMLEYLLNMSIDVNSIVLDSFAGSGTTAHAVLNLNQQDGGHRKFILIEMEDYAESITAERVKRVINGYSEGNKATQGTGGSFAFYELGKPIL